MVFFSIFDSAHAFILVDTPMALFRPSDDTDGVTDGVTNGVYGGGNDGGYNDYTCMAVTVTTPV